MSQTNLEKAKQALQKIIENPNLCLNCGKPLSKKELKNDLCEDCKEKYEDYLR
jgi:predicted amidophosphoribosyltransferase